MDEVALGQVSPPNSHSAMYNIFLSHPVIRWGGGGGTRGSVVFDAMCYKPYGCGFDYDEIIGFFPV
jgi:hypothetical protein